MDKIEENVDDHVYGKDMLSTRNLRSMKEIIDKLDYIKNFKNFCCMQDDVKNNEKKSYILG